MKSLRLLLVLIFLSVLAKSSTAQRKAEIAFSGGVVNYIGDLANEKFFPYSSAATGAAVTLRNFAGSPRNRYKTFDMQVRLSWHRLQYDETDPIGDMKGLELRNYLRGISFRNDLFGAETGFTYNIFLNRNQPLWKPSFSFFVMAGIGVFYGQPKADLFRGDATLSNRYFFWKDGSVRDRAENPQGIGKEVERDGRYETNLRNWNTEGQGYDKEIHRTAPYDLWNIGIPLGAGVRYVFNKQWTFSAELNYYYFFTDFLDDVSERYATYEELRAAFPDDEQFEMAKYISDPTGLGTDGYISAATSRRGNPELKDAFSFFSVEASYKFTWKKKSVYGQFTSR
jgi:hypothetical protein